MKELAVGLLLSVSCLFLSGQVMAETITIFGTGSGSSVLEAVGSAFSQNNPGVTVAIPKSIGSGGGIKAVGNDKNVIGRVARGISRPTPQNDNQQSAGRFGL